MAKCEHCGYPHAHPGNCSDCGSTDPLPSRQFLRLAIIVALTAAFTLIVVGPIILYLKRDKAIRDFPSAPAITTFGIWPGKQGVRE